MRSLALALFFLVLLPAARAADARPQPMEQRLNQLRKSPPELYAFLLRMPKGADLHNHLSGAVYAEDLIEAAGKLGLCVDEKSLGFSKAESCPLPGSTTEMIAKANNKLWNEVVDALSMRDFVPATGESGHDHFFNTFGLFDAATKPNTGPFIVQMARRAADQNQSYIELMALSAASVNDLGQKAGFDGNFAETAAKLQAAGLAERVAALRAKVDDIENYRRTELGCEANPSNPPCRVTIRYVFQVLREFSNAEVFAQMLTGFQLASADPRVVAINFVQPEDGINSMRNYHQHMEMVAYGRRTYPNIHVTLHAGELTSGIVPPEGLRFHIREAVQIAGAERIGHGVDIMYETGSQALLSEMSKKHVAVEVNLTSNDGILGVRGLDHPFPIYRKYHVPVVLSTDDEGVARTHLTREYQRAVLTYGLTYADLKEIVRNGLEYSFLPGKSYWASRDYRAPVKECAAPKSKACEAFLAASDKARVQADLEQRFRAFEAEY